MFDSASDLDARQVAECVVEQHQAQKQAECRVLELAAHWADLHSGPVDRAERVAGERLREPGGDGTPLVQEFAAAELGALLETTTGAGWDLIGDALDLRHRLPRLWTAVRAGRVRAWKARRLARETRRLSPDGALQVDAAIDGLIGALSWTRFEDVLAAKIIEADPAGEEARAAAWEAERFVRAGASSENGLKVLVARAAAGDVIWFLAMVDRIAEILAAVGDQDLVDVRRSRAIGILARPDHALDLLRRHATPATPNTTTGLGPADQDSADQDLAADDPEPDPEGDGHTSIDLCPPADPPAGSRGLGAVARPRVELVVHVSTETLSLQGGPARMDGVGTFTLGQVRRWLLGTGCIVRVRPVVDLSNELAAADGYEIPRALRRLTGLRIPASSFPFSGATGSRLDLDHTRPYRHTRPHRATGVRPPQSRPVGQTRLGNLGPLSRSEHRLKTHSGWRVRQPEPGVFVWRSPTGHHWLTTPHAGTYPLGHGRAAQAIWQAADVGRLDLAA